jgi:hypothetical protein
VDVEAAFVYWYNNGERRTYGQVAQLLEVSDSTVRRTAHEQDWVGRADHLDRDARAMVNQQLVALRAHTMTQLVETGTAVLALFEQRQMDTLKDDSGAVIPNPYLAVAGSPSVADFVQTVKLLQSVGMVGAPDDNPADEPRQSLEELRRQVAEMNMREAELRMEEAELRAEEAGVAPSPNM